jgi:excisionase family DNA binding protein
MFEKILEEKLTEVVRKVMNEYVTHKPPQYYTPEELSQIIKVDEETIRRYCRNGDLPHTRFGKFIRIEMKDFEDYRSKNRIG